MESPRSYLFVTWEGGGNVPPVIGLARRLAARGHTVRILAEPCLEDTVEDAGCRFIPFENHFVRTNRADDIMGDWEPRTPLGALRRTMDNVLFGPASSVAQETLRAIEAEPTDVVAVDLMMPGALLAAEAARIPRVVLFHMPEYLPGPGRPAAGPGFLPREDVLGRLRDALMTRIFLRMLARYLGGINAVRRDLALPLFRKPKDILGMYHTADLRLIQTSEAFDFPIRPAPRNVRYVGPMLDDPDWAGTWTSPWPSDDPRPLVVVSLSSTFQNQGATLRNVVAALGELDVRGLVTLGPAMAAEAFSAPANVRIVSAAPHGEVFKQASAVVTHAGHGTVMRALAHGLPLLCLPMGRDQDDNAARVVASGAGLRLRPSSGPPRLRSAIRRLLDETPLQENARRMATLIRQDTAEERAVRELENVGPSLVPTPA